MRALVGLVLIAMVAAPAARAADALDAALDTCWSCHGKNGASNDPTVPIVWGQNAKYLEKQIRDFRSGDRDSQIMSSMAESIKRDDIARASERIAALAWPAHAPSPAADAPTALEACKGCHGADLKGGESPAGFAPRLAGQFADYLADQMSAFARGQRKNQDVMAAMMKALPPDEQKKLAAWLAGL